MDANILNKEIKVVEMDSNNYTNRNGYDANFLEEKVPLPRISENLIDDVVKLKDSNNEELKYTNFSAVMSKSRGLAFYTAVNIDGSKLQELERKNDVWYYDPRIERKFQYGPELYSNNDLDRGHLVRRLDPVWGPHFKNANEDTFHFSNCSPQHKNLNQKTWLGLEDYILRNADVHDLKVNVFTGPVFNQNDLIYRGKYLIPSEFWKVVTIVKNNDDHSISSTAYLQTQKQLIEDLKFVFGEYKTYQVLITKIESLTGLDFGNLRNFDPLSKRKDIIPIKIINDEKDIIL
ncbi:MAG TPA: DNA/RNA non-specific endonuclease [Nitrososphaeraceae archaeon]|nr:DNA/RNA non-specific endonuclease [Nitrososphaeraceae archaeon]